MYRFRNILYVARPGAGLTPALRRAAMLANMNLSRLTVAQVLDDAPDDSTQSTELMLRLEVLRSEELAELCLRVQELGIRPEVVLLRGRAFVAIISQVLRAGHDLVIKPAEGRSERHGTRLFGSTDHHLLRKSPAPVWLLREDVGERFHNILAAVDVSGAGNAELNTRILQLASSLARRERAELHVVHAWSVYGEALLRSRQHGIVPERLSQLLHETRNVRRLRLRKLVRDENTRGPPAHAHLVKGLAADGIVRVARRTNADMVVMGTLSRTDTQGVLIGNTAEAVLSDLDCAVLALKPHGFRTPVELAPASVPEEVWPPVLALP